MTDAEIDPGYFAFPITPERIRYRRQWGYGAGQIAYKKGVLRSVNPFTPGPFLPMHDSWLKGWDAAEKEEL